MTDETKDKPNGKITQLDFFRAKQKREKGIADAGEHADRVSTDWTFRAALAIYRYAIRINRAFLVEEITVDYPDEPPDRRAWGAATVYASRRGWIKSVGFAPAKTSNLGPKSKWVAGEIFPTD